MLKAFRRQLLPALLVLAVFTVITGLLYPLALTGIAQVAFNSAANGSLIKADGTVVGSKLIGQQFSAPQYFHPRPSAAGSGYDGAASSGSNLGPNNSTLLQDVTDRINAYRQENDLPASQVVPVDAVTASGSGLDPEISVANARLQAPRVAKARGLPLDTVLAEITKHTVDRPLGILGDSGVNVLELNLALDAK
jgi:K+-transporting ATPase ATPase C chain